MACSCGKTGSYSFTQIVQQDGSSLPSLKYLHCKYKDQFETAFAAVGINATEANLKTLAELYETGGDRMGKISGPDGNPIVFSVEDVLKSIDPTKVQNNACAI